MTEKPIAHIKDEGDFFTVLIDVDTMTPIPLDVIIKPDGAHWRKLCFNTREFAERKCIENGWEPRW